MTIGKQKKVLLIGGGGFIGQHLALACCKAGMKVRIADIVTPISHFSDNHIEFIQGNYRDLQYLYRIVDSVDYVVHLAHDTILLNVDCDMSVEIERNILPAIQLMNVCSDTSISKLLFVSSGGTVYGDPVSHEPISEEASAHPISVYGATKLMIENLGFLYRIQKDLPFIVARPGNAYGQGQLPFKGQGFIATALATAKFNQQMKVFGDGSVVRDYIHVIDIADAIVAMLQYGKIGEIYNVGTSHGTSIRKLIDEFIAPILAKENYMLNCEYESERLADVHYNVLASDKLLRDTGFSPRINLNDGLYDTWEWIKKTQMRMDNDN